MNATLYFIHAILSLMGSLQERARLRKVLLLLVLCSLFGFAASPTFAKDDKTPPVISELIAESITDRSTTIRWTTDEPADSNVRYGVSPQVNTNGPDDVALVLTHSLVITNLQPNTTYTFCVRSRDSSKNKSEECSSFATLGEGVPPEPARASGLRSQGTFILSGTAYPHARVRAFLTLLPEQFIAQVETIATSDGSFSVSFTDKPSGLYAFTLSATDRNGVASTQKGFSFGFLNGFMQSSRQQIIFPPTLSIERAEVAWGDNIVGSGSSIPSATVVVHMGTRSYETRSDAAGQYRVLINTAPITPGKYSLRARVVHPQHTSYEYSLTRLVTIIPNSVPKADLNGDGAITLKDMSIFLAHPVDLNNDKIVNAMDMSIFLRAFR